MSNGAVQMLQKSLSAAQKDLTSTNTAIKRMIGRDPDEPPSSRQGPERRTSGGGRMRAWSEDFDSPASKKRDFAGSRLRLAGRLGPRPGEAQGRLGPRPGEAQGRLGPRLGEAQGRLGPRPGEAQGRLGPRPGEAQERKIRRDSDGEENSEKGSGKPIIQSSVIATTVPPRPKGDPGQDEQSKKRNRRMFGFLMGTLQKFKDSEETSKTSERERRRSELEERVQQAEEVEKEMIAKERRDLFEQRKAQKNKVATLEEQMATVATYEEWNTHDRRLCKFIRTKSKPGIFYLPAQHTPHTEKLLKESRETIEEAINARQKEVEAFITEPSSGQQESMETGGGEGVGGRGEVEGGRKRVGSESGEASGSDD